MQISYSLNYHIFPIKEYYIAFKKVTEVQISHLVIPVVLPQPLVGPVRGLEGDVAVEELVLPHLSGRLWRVA